MFLINGGYDFKGNLYCRRDNFWFVGCFCGKEKGVVVGVFDNKGGDGG